MPSGRTPRGQESITVVASTKVTESEREELINEYGTMYLALRAGLECLMGTESEHEAP